MKFDEDGEPQIRHFGVKGMRCGVRKDDGPKKNFGTKKVATALSREALNEHAEAATSIAYALRK